MLWGLKHNIRLLGIDKYIHKHYCDEDVAFPVKVPSYQSATEPGLFQFGSFFHCNNFDNVVITNKLNWVEWINIHSLFSPAELDVIYHVQSLISMAWTIQLLRPWLNYKFPSQRNWED